MAKIIGLPKLSPTMEEGTLVRWVKQEGESFEVDDLIAEVETDKATMEFRSFDKSTLLKQLVEEGTTVEPEAPVAIFGEKGEDISALLEEVGAGGGATAAAPSTPSPQKKDGDPSKASKQPHQPEPATAAATGGRVLASPFVRKVAREQDIDLAQIQGSGPGGRIIKRDLDESGRVGEPGRPVRGPSIPPSARRPGAAAKAPAPQSLPDTSGGRVEKLSQMRKTIARRLTESKQTVPHFYLTIDVDAHALVAARAMMNKTLEGSGEKVSLNDLIIKACAQGLRSVPACNASFNGDSIVYHDRVDISVAVAVPEGLLTPVVRGADRLGVLEINRQVRDLAGRAKDKKLKPEEMMNGTFSVSNLGMFGIDVFSAVINPPEGAILAVSQVRDEPVVKDGQVVAGKRMALTLSCDHRVIDGAVGATFLKALRRYLEQPLTLVL